MEVDYKSIFVGFRFLVLKLNIVEFFARAMNVKFTKSLSVVCFRHYMPCINSQLLFVTVTSGNDWIKLRLSHSYVIEVNDLKIFVFFSLRSNNRWEPSILVLKYQTQYVFLLYEGGSIIPCNHLFSLHMGAFIQRWQCLHQVWTFVFHAM